MSGPTSHAAFASRGLKANAPSTSIRTNRSCGVKSIEIPYLARYFGALCSVAVRAARAMSRNASVALMMSACKSYMLCPAPCTILSSISGHDLCSSNAVTGGQMRSFPPCTAMHGMLRKVGAQLSNSSSGRAAWFTE
eukprot:6175999-Pleurochrysis_carterae.AAC.3